MGSEDCLAHEEPVNEMLRISTTTGCGKVNRTRTISGFFSKIFGKQRLVERPNSQLTENVFMCIYS
jgi:hypothetical protein